MRCCLSFVSALVLTATVWLAIACVDQPVADLSPAARVVTAWEPRMCGDPHRVAIELEDEDGVLVSGSVPCSHGMLALDVRHLGFYFGRAYAWSLEPPTVRSVMPLRLAVDEPLVRWWVQTPQ